MAKEPKQQERQEPTKKQQKVGPPSGLGKKGGRDPFNQLLGNSPGKKKLPIIIKMGKEQFILNPGKDIEVMNFSKGGRAGYKMGSKCKLATKGKGRAYGKNS